MDVNDFNRSKMGAVNNKSLNLRDIKKVSHKATFKNEYVTIIVFFGGTEKVYHQVSYNIYV